MPRKHWRARLNDRGTQGSLWQQAGTLNNKRRIAEWNRPFSLTSTMLTGTRLLATAFFDIL
jgi:hypothetical protein